MATEELILTESRTMRAQTIKRTDVLDKVKALALLPDGIHATTEIVASYYEVGIEAVKSLVKDNRAELDENDYRVLTGAERTAFVRSQKDLTLPPARHLALFTRRTMLNVGQLLRDSDVAKHVRTYLLDVEEGASPEQREAAIEDRRLRRALGLVQIVAAMDDSIDPKWKRSKQLHHYAVAAGEEADIAPEDRTLMVDPYLIERGLTLAERKAVRSGFGKSLVGAYRMEHGGEQPKDSFGLVDGRERPVKSYTEADRPLFDKVWNALYADRYPAQQFFTDGAA